MIVRGLPGHRPSPYWRRVGFHDVSFRGLLDVHSRYGPPARRTAQGSPLTSKALAGSLPRRRLRLLPVGTIRYRRGSRTHRIANTCTAHVESRGSAVV